jgi:hypothetical protein
MIMHFQEMEYIIVGWSHLAEVSNHCEHVNFVIYRWIIQNEEFF